MCKVANQRGSDHEQYIRFQADHHQDHEYGGDEYSQQTSQGLNQPSSAPNYQQHQQQVNLTATADAPPAMFSGYSRPTEMLAMVSALTHVVSGQGQSQRAAGYGSGLSGGGVVSSAGLGQALYSPSGSGSGSGSGTWSGQKRGREDDVESASHQLLESSSSSSSRAYRGLPHDFRATQQLDSSPTTATGQFDFILNLII